MLKLVIYFFMAIMNTVISGLNVFIQTKTCSIAFDHLRVNITLKTSIDVRTIRDINLDYLDLNHSSDVWRMVENCQRKDLSYENNVTSIMCYHLFSITDSNLYDVRINLRSVENTTKTLFVYHSYIPVSNAFYCFTDHNIKRFNVVLSTDNSIKVQYEYTSYDRIYYVSSAELQLYDEMGNITQKVDVDTMSCTPCLPDILTGLTPCHTYNICVVTDFVVAVRNIQCFNATTAFSGPVPKDLKAYCINKKKNIFTLDWDSDVSEKSIPSRYFYSSVETSGRNTTYNKTTTSLQVVGGSKAYVKTCTKCGCSDSNHITISNCKNNTSIAIIAASIVALAVMVVIIVIIIFWISKRNKKNQLSPRHVENLNSTQSPVFSEHNYEEISEYQTLNLQSGNPINFPVRNHDQQFQNGGDEVLNISKAARQDYLLSGYDDVLLNQLQHNKVQIDVFVTNERTLSCGRKPVNESSEAFIPNLFREVWP